LPYKIFKRFCKEFNHFSSYPLGKDTLLLLPREKITGALSAALHFIALASSLFCFFTEVFGRYIYQKGDGVVGKSKTLRSKSVAA
jgi:hypothetical protein